MKIAIIGMGVSGISVLREWKRKQEIDPSIEITVFGDEKTFGTGKAYQKDFEGLLMNQAANITSIVPENNNDFVEWLEENYGEEHPESNYYPRAQFGAYLTERMNGWLSQSEAEVIYEKIERIIMLPNNRLRLNWSSNTVDFDGVHLCIGNLPYQDPFDLIDHPNVIGDPFPMEENLSTIPHGATVGVLGTGLTSIDVFRYTSSQRPDLNVSFFSHSGTFKTIIAKEMSIENRLFTKENIEQTKEKNNGFITLETYIKWFKKELDDQQLSNNQLGSKNSIERELHDSTKLGMIQTVLNNMDLFLTDIWMALTETDKQAFLHTYYKKWDKLRSPFPPATAKDLIGAWEENKIKVFDNLVHIVENDESFIFKLKNQEPQQIDYVINATGNEVNVSFEMNQMPLLRQLLNERILQSETFGGVQVSVPNLSAISQKYGILHTLKVHGQLISGIQFGNNSVRIISTSAQAAVRDMMKQINNG